MNATTRLAIAVLLGALLAAAPATRGNDAAPERLPAPEKPRPKVEVVFVLDTTGSMSGLIEGAKVKIWKIVNQIVSGKPVPDVRVGLVAYRDRGDAYVTRFTPLTSDLDAIYGVLRGFSAGGGGDGPESVNEALHVGLTKPRWSRTAGTLRIIYLVGDAPPHMDYAQDVKYPVTCEAAARAGVIINTVQCGDMGGTGRVWKEIADRAEGRYFRIDQSGGMRTVETPYDKRLAELSGKLAASAIFYGAADARLKAQRSLESAEKDLDDAAPEARAERAGYLAKSGRIGGSDLLSLLERKELKLAELKEEHLPDALREMTPETRKAHIEALLEKRKALRAQMLELDGKRAAFVKAKLEKQGRKGDAFDEKVVQSLREQAAKVGIEYD
jgi:Mg-chelatase subunit ChlD